LLLEFIGHKSGRALSTPSAALEMQLMHIFPLDKNDHPNAVHIRQIVQDMVYLQYPLLRF